MSVLAQITPMELTARLDSTEIANGFMNRFVIVAAKRSKFLPRGGNIPLDVRARAAGRVQDALDHARQLGEVDMTADGVAGVGGDVRGRWSPGRPAWSAR